jgi:hypothetical protein
MHVYECANVRSVCVCVVCACVCVWCVCMRVCVCVVCVCMCVCVNACMISRRLSQLRVTTALACAWRKATKADDRKNTDA